MTHPYFILRWLPVQLAAQQSRLKICSLLLQETCLLLCQNAAIQTNVEDTAGDYSAFSDSADTEASQTASDTTNKCDLELGSAAVSR